MRYVEVVVQPQDNQSLARILGNLRRNISLSFTTGAQAILPQDTGSMRLSLRGTEPEDFYEVINEGYERGSVLVTSNRDYQEWPAAFGDNPLMASAALDRLAHRAHLITIKGVGGRLHHAAGRT